MRSSGMKSMRYIEYGAIHVYTDLILRMGKASCRGPVVSMIHILVVNLWID